MSTTGVNKSHWNWTKIGNIGLHVVEILVIISIIKFFMQLFGGNGTAIGAGLASVFGNAINFVNGILNGCNEQQDCSKGKNSSEDCDEINNCSYREITTSNNPGPGPGPGPAVEKTIKTCVSSNGTPTGGGISTMGCGLLLTLILVPIIALLSVVGVGLYKWWGNKPSKSADDLELRTGTPISKDVINKIATRVESIDSTAKDEGISLNDETIKKLTEQESFKTISEELINLGADVEEVKNVTAAEDAAAQGVSDSFDNNEKGREDEQRVRQITEDPHTDPIELASPEAYEVMIRKSLSTDHDVVIDDVFKTFLIKHINRLGLSINTTEQAVLEGNYNGQPEIKDSIYSVITSSFSSH